VSPELIDAATADAKWQQPFDASLTDVFKVQTEVAGQVAAALDVAIGSRQQELLADRPTANLAAYDAYLKGKAARGLGNNVVTLRQAITYEEQAVALDSTFAAAWVTLSGASSLMYANGAPSPALADRARTAADRAIALDPGKADGYIALGTYYRLVAGSAPQAVEQYSLALKLAPNDAEVLRGIGLAEQTLGHWDRSLDHLRRSRTLDPRARSTANSLARTLLVLRRYDEAMAVANEGVALAPGSPQSLEDRVMIRLAQGDLVGARADLAHPPEGLDLPVLVAYVATYWDLCWALDTDQRALLKRLRPGAFDGDVAAWAIVLAQMYGMEGNVRRAAAYGDSAVIAVQQQLKATPEDAQRNVLLGLALAYAGRKDDAIRAGLRGVSLAPISSDAEVGPYFQHQLARIYILVGEPDKAMDQLEPLLKIPYHLSPGWLRIDPTFDPLRNNPRFRKLVEGTA
jgi:tetratricopeptide (TPR) repeat protein